MNHFRIHNACVVFISVVGTRGGIGTSTFCWALAKSLKTSLLVDYSTSQNLKWVTGNSDKDTSWPFVTSTSTPVSLEILFSKAAKIDEIPIYSGGVPVALLRDEKKEVVIVDGNCDADFQIIHTTNSLQDIESNSWKTDLVVMQSIRRGVPISLLDQKPPYSYKSERSVKNSITNGLGLHSKSAVQKVAKKICEDVFSDIANIN